MSTTTITRWVDNGQKAPEGDGWRSPTTVEVQGRLTGYIWMPNALCQKDVNERFTIGAKVGGHRPMVVRAYRSGRAYSIADAVEQVTDDGDFQSARLTADTSISITRGSSRGKRTRTYWATELPSIADYVDAETWTLDEVVESLSEEEETE